ncbi:MAG TPA: pitrilysin family protein, partial [Planctomycetota bacterium]|nr:pitrilysin family protein [Planctomycetota bacterium]
MLAYRVGSVNEHDGITGVSHFFEHMVFKGTQKYKRGDIDLVTMRCGGENNAFTDYDMTGYWFHVHSSHLDEVLDILADTMGNCTLDPREFELERGPVLQEMNLWLDGGWGNLEREMGKAVYKTSGYRHPVLGWQEDVQKLTRDQMAAYYKAHYRPDNASLIVVGDVDAEDVYRRAERFFGALPRGREPPPPR